MFELGETVRPSVSYLNASRHYKWLCADSIGRVTGYRAPKIVGGAHIGVVEVLWETTGMSVPMRWDQLERVYG